MPVLSQHVALPHEEEVRKLRIVDVVEERRIADDRIDALVREMVALDELLGSAE